MRNKTVIPAKAFKALPAAKVAAFVGLRCPFAGARVIGEAARAVAQKYFGIVSMTECSKTVRAKAEPV